MNHALTATFPPRSLVIAVLAGIALLVGLACSPAVSQPAVGTPAGKAAATQPAAKPTAAAKAQPARTVPEGTVLMAAPSLPVAWSTGAAGGAGGSNQYYWPVFDGLTRMDVNGDLHPALARRWSTEDGQTWTFELRDDIEFHDGTPFEAQDVLGTFAYYRNASLGLTATALFANVDTIEAPDDHTVVIRLKGPQASFAKFIALALVAKGRDLEADGSNAEEFFGESIGTGPYRFVDFASNASIDYEAAGPDFVSPRGVAPVSNLGMRSIPEMGAREAALRTGEVQIIDNVVADIAAGLEADGFTVIRDSGVGQLHLTLNVDEGPTAELGVRQALNHAVNTAAIIENVLGGAGIPDSQLIGPSAVGYNDALEPYPYDPERARELLAEAGFPDGFSTSLEVFPAFMTGTQAEAVAADLAEVGVDAPINMMDGARFREGYYGPMSARPGLWTSVTSWDQTFEADAVFRWYSSDFPNDFGRRWQDETFDALYQEAKVTLDEAERRRLYEEAAAYLHEQAPVVFLWIRLRDAAYDQDVIEWSDPGYFATMLTADNLSLKQ